jgi:hypothetical protein
MSAPAPQHECGRIATNDDTTSKEMLIMLSNDFALQAEFDYRHDRLLEEAEAERIANQMRKAASARSR